MRATARLLPLALSLLLIACSGGDEPAVGDSADEARAADANGAADSDDDLRDLQSYDLSMSDVDRFYEAQRNVMMAMKDLSPEQREALDVDDEDSNNADLDQMVAHVESTPILNDAIRKADISAREYVMTMMALFQASMAMAVADMRPELDQDSLAREMQANPKNIAFVREHAQALQQKQQAFEAEMQAAGVSEDQ